MRAFLVCLFIGLAQAAHADVRDVQLTSIDGGMIEMSDWEGRPVLVVNTASQCAYTGQYEALQTLYDTYRERGLVVLAVPSDDFRQELDSAGEVREFCEMAFGLDMPMTDILTIKGANAHPLYEGFRETAGFVPRWNFNKVLIGADGRIVETWGARTAPMSRPVRSAVEAALVQAEF
ncbi:glutathione peroxidase [uncultured Tateyamaria sp.]|uniref:glutathione peroxidase n=1 Tax=uncultured Tateyamaria sp. TaxID=455651 RepID=UPI002628C8A5|nr:glutathione peroxidase [uncultured Tateyamaria sp.]